jgi:hypothetical protein
VLRSGMRRWRCVPAASRRRKAGFDKCITPSPPVLAAPLVLRNSARVSKHLLAGRDSVVARDSPNLSEDVLLARHDWGNLSVGGVAFNTPDLVRASTRSAKGRPGLERDRLHGRSTSAGRSWRWHRRWFERRCFTDERGTRTGPCAERARVLRGDRATDATRALLLRRRLRSRRAGAAAAGRAFGFGPGRAGVVRHLDLVGDRRAREDLDVDAVG